MLGRLGAFGALREGPGADLQAQTEPLKPQAARA